MRRSPLKRRSHNKKAVTRVSLGKVLSEWVRESPCHLCGRPSDHAHHILTRGSEPCLKLCPDNLMPLCERCHENAHRSPASFRVYLEASRPGIFDHLRTLARKNSKRDLDEVEKEIREATKRPWSERFKEVAA